jgi:F0F1-type ATP synthase membrane subunit b/b'
MLELLAHEPFFFRWEIAAVQMAGFVLFYLVMKWLLFDRLLGFIRMRREALDAAARRIEAARKDVERLTAEYQVKLAAADKAAYEEMQKVVKEGIAAKGAILLAAQEDGRKVVDEARTGVTAEKEAALRMMDAQVRALAADVAASATGGTMTAAELS